LQATTDAFATPLSDDLVIAVSHMWFYQAHPDPLGEKATLISQLVGKAQKAHPDVKGSTLLFFDFLSISQQPFAKDQSSRSLEEHEAFTCALRSMPQLYLYADAVVLLDSTARREVPGDGACVTVEDDLSTVTLRRLGDAFQVASSSGNAAGPQCVELFDVILNVNGEPFHGPDSVNRVEQVELLKAPFGLKSLTNPAERGWIYLERFIAMVRVAMSTEEEAKRVVFSESPSLLSEIHAQGQTLKRAAKGKSGDLHVALEWHLEELKRKTFSASSADKIDNVGGVGGQTSGSAQLQDRDLVEQIMSEMVTHLVYHWEEEVSALAKRRYKKALRLITASRTLARANTMETSAAQGSAAESSKAESPMEEAMPVNMIEVVRDVPEVPPSPNGRALRAKCNTQCELCTFYGPCRRSHVTEVDGGMIYRSCCEICIEINRAMTLSRSTCGITDREEYVETLRNLNDKYAARVRRHNGR
jgi:hypothetical protein